MLTAKAVLCVIAELKNDVKEFVPSQVSITVGGRHSDDTAGVGLTSDEASASTATAMGRSRSRRGAIAVADNAEDDDDDDDDDAGQGNAKGQHVASDQSPIVLSETVQQWVCHIFSFLMLVLILM